MAFFYARFAALVLWYRCKQEGNIIENTTKIYLIRVLTDLSMYILVISGIIGKSSETEEGSEGSEETEESLGLGLAHIVFICIIFLWELLVYVICVRRALYKLNKENDNAPPKNVDDFIRAMWMNQSIYFLTPNQLIKSEVQI